MTALYCTTANGKALVYLSNHGLQSLLTLCERTTQFKSLKQRRIIAMLVERLSLVPSEGEGTLYCFDRQRSTTKRHVEIVDEDIIPVEITEIESDSDRWRRCIAFWCFQKDQIV